MPCRTPVVPSPLPSLSELLAQLNEVDPIGAEQLRAEVESLEERQRALRAQLDTAEHELQRVTLDEAAYDDWVLRHTDATGLRHKESLLGVDARNMRSQLERELFLARHARKLGRQRCRMCGGSGEGEQIEAGTCLVASYCDACAGSGFEAVPVNP